MASSSSLTIPELSFSFLSPKTTPKHFLSLSTTLSLSKTNRRRNNLSLRTRVLRAVKDDSSVAIEERESELIKQVNGAASTSSSSSSSYNGLVVEEEEYKNGGVSENGSLVKYLNGNGVAAAEVVVGEAEEVSETKEGSRRKKTIEEIGQEEAWFKRSGQDQTEVV